MIHCASKRAPLFLLLSVASLLSTAKSLPAQQADRAWLHKVRIAAYRLTPKNAEQIVQQAQASGVYGIEVDNDIPGRYESFWNPSEKLEAIRLVAAAAHRVTIKRTYTSQDSSVSPLMRIARTPWPKSTRSGCSVSFPASPLFSIPTPPSGSQRRRGCVGQSLCTGLAEDVHGAHPPDRSTGIDGIYVDIPYWMTHFTGWEDSWASFDDYTVAAFRAQTGLDARKDVKLGDMMIRVFASGSSFAFRPSLTFSPRSATTPSLSTRRYRLSLRSIRVSKRRRRGLARMSTNSIPRSTRSRMNTNSVTVRITPQPRARRSIGFNIRSAFVAFVPSPATRRHGFSTTPGMGRRMWPPGTPCSTWPCRS